MKAFNKQDKIKLREKNFMFSFGMLVSAKTLKVHLRGFYAEVLSNF